MTIVYSLVARGATILCTGHTGSEDFTNVANRILPNIPTQNDARTTYTSNNYMFHVMIENGIIFMCAANSDFGRKQPYAFLDEIKRRFNESSLAQRAQFANSDEFDRDFKQVLTSQMERFSDASNTDALGQLQNQVSEVKGIMVHNIDKVLERGENLDQLMQTTEDLEAHGSTFHKTARRVQRKMWWKNLKMKIILGLVVTVIFIIILLVILFSTGVLPVKNSGGGDGSATPAPTQAPTPTLSN